MSKAAYMGVGGTARKVKKMYIGVNGVARKVKKAYIGVGGVAKLFYSSGLDFSNSTFTNTIGTLSNTIAGDISNGVIVMRGSYYYSSHDDDSTYYSYPMNTIARSTDNGYTWANVTLPISKVSNKIIACKSNIIITNTEMWGQYQELDSAQYCVSNNSGASWNAATWTITNSNNLIALDTSYLRLRGLFSADEYFVAYATNYYTSYGDHTPGAIMKSYDGVSWEGKVSSDLGLPNDYGYIDKHAGEFGKLFTNGKYWFGIVSFRDWRADYHVYRSASSDPFSQYSKIGSISYDSIAVGTGGDSVASPFCTNWAHSDDGNIIIGVGSYGNATGGENTGDTSYGSGCYLVSTDGGYTWQGHSGKNLAQLAYYDGAFVGVSVDNYLLWSYDGINWNMRDISSYFSSSTTGCKTHNPYVKVIKCSDGHFIVNPSGSDGSLRVLHFNG